jgi:NAD(P)-dependent dehydrogenase (short-subunit alcohol dehydrogenase family)
MGANGAKHIIVVSRSGVRTESAIKLVEELTLTGVHIEGLKCDVADRASLNKTLEATLTRMPKIRGVVVAAMVLEVAMLRFYPKCLPQFRFAAANRL